MEARSTDMRVTAAHRFIFGHVESGNLSDGGTDSQRLGLPTKSWGTDHHINPLLLSSNKTSIGANKHER
jgi:hypothetical protein